jgi:sigma-54 dependent transcriptional regulator, acetoin dehydrogenase operon transcriptional activator AcoR
MTAGTAEHSHAIMQNPGAKQHTTHSLNDIRALQRTSDEALISGFTSLSSWRHCAFEYSLDPLQQCAPTSLQKRALEERRAGHMRLVQIAAAEIERLYEYIDEPGYAVILTDGAGTALYERTERAARDPFRVAATAGDNDCESLSTMDTGTADDSPPCVLSVSCQVGISCTGVPIHDPSGAMLAMLEACVLHTVEERPRLTHAATLVSRAARLIERCMFLRHFQHSTVLRFQTRPQLLDRQRDGALALASDATVIAVDETALRLLGDVSRSELIGKRVEEIFDVRLEDLTDTGHGARAVRDLLLGRRFFASVDRPPLAERAPSPPAQLTELPHVMQFAPAAERRTPLTLEELAGQDPQMLRNVRSAHRIAASRVPVMIQGPTGAGKEMFARALHAASDRAAQQFVALNCAAIPESLIESELFGYRSGAFTGARREGMKGKILQSSAGTLFLDEIGDMPVLLQTRLLRVLEEQEVVPLGTETPLKVDLRVISASHQNLRAMITRGQFREDLYYRLNGITLELPPLMQRTDRERLIREFLAAETRDGRPAAIEVDAFQCLLAYSWPGNIRELRNVIRTALAICDGGVVRLRDLPSEVRHDTAPERPANAHPAAPAIAQPPGPQAGLEREQVLCAIHDSDGNMSRAAQLLGVSRNTLYRRCKRLEIPLHRPVPPAG